MLVIIRLSQDTLYEPSAYASGALVKCRKVGAANWGNKSEAYEVTNADKKGNTPAYQGFKAGKKNKLTGKPLYKAAPHMKENAVEIQNSDGQTIAGVVDIVELMSKYETNYQ